MFRSCLIFFSLVVSFVGTSQSYKFKKYSEQEGLSNRFIYTINQDEIGNLLIGTGEGLYKYDGYNFEDKSTSNDFTDNFFTCSYYSLDHAIWYGHNNGSLTKYKNGNFEHIDLSMFTQSRINSIIQDKNKNLWVLTQNDGLLKKSEQTAWQQLSKGIEDFTLYSFYIDESDHIWIGTDMGLLRATVNDQNEIIYENIELISETKVTSINPSGEFILVGTEDQGIFKIKLAESGYEISIITYNQMDLSDLVVNAIFEDEDKNLLISTNNQGLIQLIGPIENRYLKMIKYEDSKLIKTRSMKTCWVDREGIVWVGTMGDGLLKLTDNYFSTFTYSEDHNDASIAAIFEKNDTIWAGSMQKIYISYEDPSNVIDSLVKSNGLPPSDITSIFQDDLGVLWVGTNTGELLNLKPGKKKFEKIQMNLESQNQRINDIIGFKSALYVATDYGIYQLSEGKLLSHISIQSGLPHNIVKSLFRDSKGKIWLGTNNSQITYIEDGTIKNIPVPLENALIQSRCITEDNFGNIWIGTDGLGVLKITGEQITILGKKDGLYSDYCYSVVCDHRNKLWIGHHGAISKINILSHEIEIIDPGTAFNISFNDNAVDVTASGIILFGISSGVLRYEPDKDNKNIIEPIINFKKIGINDSIYASENAIKLAFGEYKFDFDFLGISLKNPTKVSYQYFLEGYETEWCALTTIANKEYNKIGPGDYTFKVKCFNSDGFGGVIIKEIKISVDKPFWLKWWFFVICIFAVVFTVRIIILQREKILRENQERLKVALDERTKEVVEQKELLQEKNKDITSSIQYARNIQKAMLPAIDSLKNYFAEAFVYYKPRDIVSGDFYWVEQFENTIVVSCADCTGHGVPGAFMSLIGSTLLKEVSSKKYVQSSRDVLTHLDSELSNMLNKQEDIVIEDGMDIIVFDYHLDTKKLNIASANRPAILFHNNEWIEIKGDRMSIGGSGERSQKEFSQHEFEIKKGDMIYLFSDGITDQFGGDYGKKLKRSGLFNWIKDHGHLSMMDQRQIIKDNFNGWKGAQEQVDDIILIGIRF